MMHSKRLHKRLMWIFTCMMLVWPITVQTKENGQPAFITNAYFADKLEVEDQLVKPGKLVNVLPARNPSMVGYFVMDALLARTGEHVFEIEIVDGKRKKVAEMSFDPVESQDREHVYTVVGSVAGAFPPGWLYFKVYDRHENGPRIHISTFSIMAQEQSAAGSQRAKATQPATPPSLPKAPEKKLTEPASKLAELAKTASFKEKAEQLQADLLATPSQSIDPLGGYVKADNPPPVIGKREVLDTLTTSKPAQSKATDKRAGFKLHIGEPKARAAQLEPLRKEVAGLGLPVTIGVVRQNGTPSMMVISGPYKRKAAAQFAQRFIEQQLNTQSAIIDSGESITRAVTQRVSKKQFERSSQPLSERAEPISAAKMAAGANHLYVVALGSFGNPENAQRLSQGLATEGVSILKQVVRSKGRRYTRVFAGPFQSKLKAKLVSRQILASHELSGSIRRWSRSQLAKVQKFTAAADTANTVQQGLARQAAQPAPQAVTLPKVSPRPHAVQIVSYLDLGSANLMERRLVQMGLPAFQSPALTNGRRLIRVMVGPYPSKLKAQEAARYVHGKIGMQGAVVLYKTPAAVEKVAAPVIPAPALPATSESLEGEPRFFNNSGRQDFTVYAGFFSSEDNAKRLVRRMGRLELNGFYRQVEVRGRSMNSVCAGPFPSMDAAQRAVELLRSQLDIARPIIRDATFSGRQGMGCGPGRSR
uniref:SPOR domain-containing protein n=1 Tax=Magnetococcus massalia (strain MO-1) TaxID=451514 RepID=A0A1S7LKF4_MAGMO|nr:conserved exported protein of unknown function [Include 3 repeat domains involving in sporulation and cell division in some model bacteria] [Candidatus Magnetococcus massalia]